MDESAPSSSNLVSDQHGPGLRRDLGRLQSYATLIGIFIGAGAFVVTARAGSEAGPSVFLAYLLMGPILLATSVAYMVFLSTPLGVRPGGAYIHISRTFGSYYIGYIAMWMKLIGFLGALAVLAMAFGEYMTFFFPDINQAMAATLCLTVLYSVSIVGIRYYGWLQTVMTSILLVSLTILIIPGLFAVELEHYSPLLPYGWDGLLTAMATLFFGYAGFETLAQTAGETKDPRSSLPTVFFRGICISVFIYVLMAFVAFGVVPFKELAASETAMADVASVYLPFGGPTIVAIGALMAFTTSINGSILVPSRILLVFAEDRILPEFKFLHSAASALKNRSDYSSNGQARGFLRILAMVFSCLSVVLNLTAISQRFRTPHVSLIISFIISVTLIWTGTIDYMLSVALQGVFILYVIHGAAVIALPFIRPTLYSKAKTKFSPALIVLTGLFSMASIIWFSRQLFIGNTSATRLIIAWVLIGTLLYAMARWEGKKDGHDYAKRLVEEWQ